MIHLGALPGTPGAEAPLSAIVQRAAADAEILARAGFDALLIENMHDVPYLCGRVGPEIVAAMTAAGCAVRAASALPLGVQTLAGANREALAVALACGAEFIRAENFVFAHVADEGLMAEASAGELLRYRRMIGAGHVAVLADVKKKHASHALTADVSLADAVRAAEFFRADGVILTGAATGTATAVAEVRDARAATRMPVFVGSGVTPENLGHFWAAADGFIVGSSLKEDGHWASPVSAARAAALVTAAEALRAKDRVK